MSVSYARAMPKLFAPLRLATADAQCWKCKATTPVHALVASDMEDAEAELDRIGEAVFVWDVDGHDMPVHLAVALRAQAPGYIPRYSRTQNATVWANGCASCGALQGGWFLHSEPDGPFFGMPRDYSGHIKDLSDTDVDLDEASYGLG